MIKNAYVKAARTDGLKSFIRICVLLMLIFTIISILPSNIEEYGVLSVVPAMFLVIYIFKTKRILEALILSSLIGFMIVYKEGFFTHFTESITNVLLNEDIAWLIIVCGLMGSIISLIERAGGAKAFGDWVSKRAKSKRSALLWTWVLGTIIFVDDYLNSLTVGSCMSPITDKHKVSREYLSYIVDSTAAPICVLIPISTWSVFCAKLLEVNGWAPAGEGVLYFIKTIPFNFYGWFGALTVLLVILGVIPIFGPMKKAEERAQKTGVLAPPGSEKIDIKAGEKFDIPENTSVACFFLPIIVLIASTLFFKVDMLKGVIFTVAFMYIYFVGKKIMTAEEFADTCVHGIKNMILPLVLIVLAFLFAEANEQIGFTEFVITSASKYMTPQLMPVILFIVLGLTEFITGTSWGMFIIAFPIVIPLSMAVGANTALCVSAIMSAGVWGAHICFYSDATILSSSATGCNNFDHAITQAPFGLLAAGLSAICYLISGFIF